MTEPTTRPPWPDILKVEDPEADSFNGFPEFDDGDVYVSFTRGWDLIRLDGNFCAAELEQLAAFMRSTFGERP